MTLRTPAAIMINRGGSWGWGSYEVKSEARMPGIQTDPLDTAGALFVAVVGLGVAWWGGMAVLHPRRPPEPFEGPVWVVRSWGLGYVLSGLCTSVRMVTTLFGREPAWLTAVYWVVGPLLICSIAAAYVIRRRARRRDGKAPVGRHKATRPVLRSEAALVIGACWAVSVLGHSVTAALDEPLLPVAPLIGAGLVRWFWTRHHSWPAAVAAGLAGAVVLFGLVDVLRPELNRYVADALATGAAATSAVAALVLAERMRERRHATAR
ncbi:hypothetical protein ACWDTR_19470 [Streptomyces sp. NPDC003470]|uniref:hypothetical protein n=1 Tax=Streptomyces sp. NPDC127100 TaxID=3347138 RepID=UPI003653FDED